MSTNFPQDEKFHISNIFYACNIGNNWSFINSMYIWGKNTTKHVHELHVVSQFFSLIWVKRVCA